MPWTQPRAAGTQARAGPRYVIPHFGFQDSAAGFRFCAKALPSPRKPGHSSARAPWITISAIEAKPEGDAGYLGRVWNCSGPLEKTESNPHKAVFASRSVRLTCCQRRVGMTAAARRSIQTPRLPRVDGRRERPRELHKTPGLGSPWLKHMPRPRRYLAPR